MVRLYIELEQTNNTETTSQTVESRRLFNARRKPYSATLHIEHKENACGVCMKLASA